MQRPIEITFRNTPPAPEIERVIRREAGKLERFHRGVVGCRVAIERPQRFQRQGNLFRVRIYVTGPTRRPVVVTREPLDSDMHDDLRTIVLGAFRAARRQLQALAERQRGDGKPIREPRALVVRLFPASDYGFLKTLEGRELYFHRNSVLHGDFDRLTVGTEVRFEESDEGEQGPQASTVQVVGKPGVRVPDEGPAAIRPPRGWEAAGARRGRRRRKRGATG
jgi:cold shock CspA family protein